MTSKRTKIRNGAMPFFCASFLFCACFFFDAALARAEDWKQVCEEARNTPFPSGDRTLPEATKGLESCSSMDLYFGFDRPADPVKARQCAYLEMDRGDDEVFGGSSILMMIYANGKGARRNLDLAIKLACGIEGAPAEVEGRVAHLARLKRENWQGDDFSLCDDITSGFMEGHCAALRERFKSSTREGRLSKLTAAWTGKDKKAFETLEGALQAFVQSRLENEVDLSGTARAALQIEEESSLRKVFLSAVEECEHEKLPRFSAQQAAAADGELNAIYMKIQTKSDFSSGTVTREGIKKTQRAWLKYRDAWVAFGQQKYPGVDADSWKAWLTGQRVEMLKEFL